MAMLGADLSSVADLTTRLYQGPRRTADFADPFVPLPENRFAGAAMARLAECRDARRGQLVYLYGPAGCGKSHLVSTFLRQERLRPDGDFVTRTTGAELRERLAEGQPHDEIAAVRDELLSAIVLVVEDVGSLSGFPMAQQFLKEAIDETVSCGGRVLLTAAKSPGELERVTPQLINRFHGGTCVGIEPLGVASRTELLSHFARKYQLAIPADILHYLAENLTSSPRELRGAMTRLDAIAAREGVAFVNSATAKRFLSDEVKPRTIDLPEIAQAVANQFDLSVGQLRTGGRSAASVLPRQIAMYLSRQLTDSSLERIATYFGRKNHGTVIHAIRRLKNRAKDQAALQRHLAVIRRALGAPAPDGSIC
ncbi:DnaA/Hda family protein [Stratiformator vulcanicus]|uniref:Chromosomal replication initiator protein DnaA n=1 Tax=Stratiformator vulcanicus TaxID=2527980 RepID=A0A517QVL4_9PLAN|nr:DnaA/Hda family protein [Stratiformator vulcanicus]QDT35648.1 Chromosomal replication initiator protein DnaA [Stratiformator vulcanicus]